jgi:hypothetical protein
MKFIKRIKIIIRLIKCKLVKIINLIGKNIFIIDIERKIIMLIKIYKII